MPALCYLFWLLLESQLLHSYVLNLCIFFIDFCLSLIDFFFFLINFLEELNQKTISIVFFLVLLFDVPSYFILDGKIAWFIIGSLGSYRVDWVIVNCIACVFQSLIVGGYRAVWFYYWQAMVKIKEINACIDCRNYFLSILYMVFPQFSQFIKF